MKLRRVISGMQTGADITGLECAEAIGLMTGGTCPKGCKTDIGPKPEWRDRFGLAESYSPDYAVRTRDNVRNAGATLWFGKVGSPGYWCTRKAAELYNKPFIENPSAQLENICANYDTINVAGNRERINPDVVGLVREAFHEIAKILGKEPQ